MSEATGNGGTSKAKAPGGRGVARPLVRVAGYYVVFLGGLGALLWANPWLTEAIIEAGGDTAFTDEITRTFGGVPMIEEPGVQGWEGLALQGLSLLGALAIMIPVAWTYIIIK